MAAYAVKPNVHAALQAGRVFEPVFEYEILDYKEQSLRLLPELLKHLEAAGLNPADCRLIACNVGPGGFTSLRTACGVAQGLATAWACPVWPVSSFDCMVAEYVHLQGASAEPLTCLIDARLQELYAAVLPGGGLEALLPEGTATSAMCIAPPCQIPANAQAAELFAPAGSKVLMDEASAALLGTYRGPQPVHVLNPTGRGAALLGALAQAKGLALEAFSLQPLYVREKVAQTTLERLAGRDVRV